ELADDVLRVDQHVEQVGDRRALVAADIAHPGLQQRLGHRQDALAAEGFAVAEPELLHLFLERAFHRLALPGKPATSITVPNRMLRLVAGRAHAYDPRIECYTCNHTIDLERRRELPA